MFPSLLDSAPPVLSRQAAAARLAELREKLSVLLCANHPDRHHINKVKADIAACREILGPPQYIPREADNARHRNIDRLPPQTQQQAPKEGGHFIAHAGKRT
jgi:hypothetical protein